MTRSSFPSLLHDMNGQMPAGKRRDGVVINTVDFDCDAGVREFLDFCKYSFPSLRVALEAGDHSLNLRIAMSLEFNVLNFFVISSLGSFQGRPTKYFFTLLSK